MVKAVHPNGGETKFSDVDWKTGLPQRYGWVEKGQAALKNLPKELVDFVFNPKEEPKAEVEVKTPKKKSDGNTKPKNRKTGKRNA